MLWATAISVPSPLTTLGPPPFSASGDGSLNWVSWYRAMSRKGVTKQQVSMRPAHADMRMTISLQGRIIMSRKVAEEERQIENTITRHPEVKEKK